MTETPEITPRSHSKRMNGRIGGFVSSRRDKMFGIAEISALIVSCFILLLVLLSYLYFLVPARSRLSSAEADRTRFQSNLQKLGGIVEEGKNTKERVVEISASLDNFEKVGLVTADEGRMLLYGELNELISKNGLRNTSGPTYTSLDPLGAKVTPGRSVNTKWQSVYPGIGVLVTVEGAYQNVRHFIQDIERSKQFVIINQVELQRATENNSAVSATPESESGTRASLVSLQLNMSTYFRRSSSEPVADDSKEQ